MTITTPQEPEAAVWPTAYPRHRGAWTLKGEHGRWGTHDPDTGVFSRVDPARDPDLPALGPSLERGNLVGYRVGRRAVIATPASYIKVVRPKRLNGLVSTHRWFSGHFSHGETPGIIRVDPTGAIELKPVGGTSLHQLLRDRAPKAALDEAIYEIASGIAAFHDVGGPRHLPSRTTDDPQAWVDTVGRADPEAAAMLSAPAERLPPLPECVTSVTHGDLHDKNVFHAPGGFGVIDLDSVATGVPEDDIVNLAVHLQLRALQSSKPIAFGQRLASRLLESYREHRALNEDRAESAAAHTWFRLACIYRFRSRSRALVPELLGQATIGC